ncbi:leucine-rich repeat protein [Roseburia sp. BX1005]|uniref:Leucine-rich repeat protein n=2 Tax=Roseburia zhanii TaxID=2763064 RepID=A0A923LQ78_9FIRM|nr:leucine-rich repeat protein [Roseburia zhanii]
MKMTKMISRKMAGGMLVGFLAVAGIVTGSQGSMTVYAAEELQGSGTADDPYVITGSEDLWQFAEIVKASSDRNQCAKVADGVTEIDTTVRGEKKDLTWSPIGDSTVSYTGVFDGNGAEITIHADRSINNNAGLFGILGSGGEIRNVTTAGSSKGWDSVGGICGQACRDAKIVNCNNKADITAQGGQAGGLVGYASRAQIESDTSISNTGAVTGTANVGGLVGQASGGMKVIVHEGILNSGAITAKSSGYVGGLIGYADLASIQADADIINTGKISSMGSNTSMGAGGLIGYGIDTSIISRNGMLQNKGEVTAAITSVGGIGGHMTSSDNSNCQIQAAKGVINTGRIIGKNSVGGVVGEYAYSAPMTSTDGFILNKGAVEGNGDNVGGVIGRKGSNSDGSKYGNMGDVTNTGKYTGGVIGSWDSNTSLENSFNIGTVKVTGENATDVGGVVGKFSGVNIKHCYHTTKYPLIGNGEEEKEEIIGKISNCYCMEKNTSPWDGEIIKTEKAFMEGEVAYLLDGSGDSRNSKLLWGQEIGKDLTPVLGGTTVYQDGSIYSNTNAHHYDEPQYAWDESKMSCTASRICEGCNKVEDETDIAAYTEEAAGCETSGKRDYRAEFANPAFEVQTKTVILNPLGHDYDESQYAWNESEMSCTASRICKRCKKAENETVTATYTEEKAGCETSGKRDYRAEFANPAFEVQTKTVTLNPLGHDTTDAVWSKDEKVHWKECKNECGKKLEQAEHTFKTVIDRQATESIEGSSHEECSVCGYQKAAVVIPVIKKEETTNRQPFDSSKNDQTTTDKNNQTADGPNQAADTLTIGQVVVNQADGASYTIKKNTDNAYEVEYKAPKNKKQTKIVVPDTIKINGVTYKVTSIAKNAFKNNKKLKTVTVGKNVSKMGANVFTGCKKLKTITIKSTKLTAKTLSKSTFKGITKAKTIKVPKKKLSTYKKLFKNSGLSAKVKVKAY